VVDGEVNITYRPKEMRPVTEYLKLQGRFKHMSKEDVDTLQTWVCKKWNRRYCPIAPPLESKEEDLALNGDHCEGV